MFNFKSVMAFLALPDKYSDVHHPILAFLFLATKPASAAVKVCLPHVQQAPLQQGMRFCYILSFKISIQQ